MGGIMRSRSLQMTLLSLSIASLFVPNFAVAENINGEITLDKGQESKTDLVVSKGGHLKGSGNQETNLSVSSAGADNTLEVRQGGQISNFRQVRVDGLTKLTNAKLSDIDELILNNKGNALWINTNSQKYDGTQVSVNNLTVENGNVLIYEGKVKVNQNLEALNSLIQIQKNDATLSVDGTLSAKPLRSV